MAKDKTVILILVAAAIAAIWYFKYYKPSQQPNTEGYGLVTTGGMGHIGTVLPDGVAGNYEIVGAPVPLSLDNSLTATDFAELVDSGDQVVQAVNSHSMQRPLERLQNLSDSYFPTIATKALPFSQAAAKPLYHSHAVNLPRVNIKGKLYEMNLAEAVRGTVPINYDPNVSLVASSQYRNEDVFNPGYMTGAFNSLHNKLTGSHKNLPMYIEGAGTAISNVGGMGVEAIYDA